MKKPNEPFLTWAEIDLSAIRHNFQVLKSIGAKKFSSRVSIGRRSHPVEILPVIKADAYGHGMIEVAAELESLGVKIFGVSDVVEGMDLRRNGFKNDILLLESSLPAFASEIVSCSLTPSVCTLELAAALNRHAQARAQKVKIHIKVDTGMGRLGVWHKDAPKFVQQVAQFPNLIIAGIFTHFPLAEGNRSFTEKQIKDFRDLLVSLGKAGRNIHYLHAANSAGLSQYDTDIFNLARPGLMLYGLYPAPSPWASENLKKKIKLKPAMSVKTQVIYVKSVSKGRGISYGHTFVAKKNMKLATLAIGYSDGYFRGFSNKSSVLIHGRRCPVVGNVTMDQIMVDVSALKSVKVGDIAVVLGKDKKQNISAEELAQHAGTINYEIVCNLGNRLPRIYK